MKIQNSLGNSIPAPSIQTFWNKHSFKIVYGACILAAIGIIAGTGAFGVIPALLPALGSASPFLAGGFVLLPPFAKLAEKMGEKSGVPVGFKDQVIEYFQNTHLDAFQKKSARVEGLKELIENLESKIKREWNELIQLPQSEFNMKLPDLQAQQELLIVLKNQLAELEPPETPFTRGSYASR